MEEPKQSPAERLAELYRTLGVFEAIRYQIVHGEDSSCKHKLRLSFGVYSDFFSGYRWCIDIPVEIGLSYIDRKIAEHKKEIGEIIHQVSEGND